MFCEGDKVFNTRLSRSGEIYKVHINLGTLLKDGSYQNAYSVIVENHIEVWLEKTDFVVKQSS